MKFTCEVCGASFNNLNECENHEKECKKHHEKALFIRDEIAILVSVAEFNKINFGVNVQDSLDATKTTFYAVECAEYDQKLNKVIIKLKAKENDENKKPEQPKKQINKKS